MKKYLLAILIAIVSWTTAFSQHYTIKQSSTNQPLVFFMRDSGDHITGKTGLSPVVTLRKNNASAAGSFGSPAGTVRELGSGWYQVDGNATDTATLGPVVLHATGASADPADYTYEVVALDPIDATVGLNQKSFFNGTGYGSIVASTTVSTVTSQTILQLTGVTDSAANLYAQSSLVIRNHSLPAEVKYAEVLSYNTSTHDFTMKVVGGATFTITVGDLVDVLPPGVFGNLAITAAKIDTDAIGAAQIATDAATEIGGASANATWESTRGAHTTTGTFGQGVASVQGNVTGSVNDLLTKTGFSLSSAGVSSIWDEPKSTHTTSGTFGFLLDIPSSTISTAGLTNSSISQAVWDLSTTSHTTAGTFGAQAKTVLDAVNATVGTTGVALADNSITAAKIATDAIGSSELAASAVAKITADNSVAFYTHTMTNEDVVSQTNFDVFGGGGLGGYTGGGTTCVGQIGAFFPSAGGIPSIRKIVGFAKATGAITIDSAPDFTVAAGTILKIYPSSTQLTDIWTKLPSKTYLAGTANSSGAVELSAGTGTLPSGSIASTSLASGAITSTAIAAGAINSTGIAANAIGASQIATGAITNAKFAAGAIDAAAIADNSIDAAAIAANAITSAKIATDAIGSAQVSTNAANKIAGQVSNFVFTDKVSAVNSATTLSLTSDLMEHDGKMVGLPVLLWDDQAGAQAPDVRVITAMSAAGGTGGTALMTIDSAPSFTVHVNDRIQVLPGNPEIASIFGKMPSKAKLTGTANSNGAVELDAATGTIGASQIASGAITSAKIASGAITNTTFAANAIDASAIADNAIDAASIASNAITSAKIATDAITSAKLATGCLTSDEISASFLQSFFLTNTGSSYSTAVPGSVVKEASVGFGGVLEGATVQLTADALTQISSSVWDTGTATHTSAGTFGAQAKTVLDTTNTAVTSTGVALADNAITANKIATNAIGASQIASNAITSAKIATDAIGAAQLATDAIGANEISSAAAAKINGGAWDITTSGHNTAGTFGALAATLATQTNTLSTDWASSGRLDLVLAARATQSSVNTLSGYVNPGVANLQTDVTAIKGYVDTEVAAIKAKTDNLPSAFPTNFSALGITSGGAISHVVLSDTITTYTNNTPQTGDAYSIVNNGTYGNSAIKTALGSSVPTTSQIATAVWNEPKSSHTTSGTYGLFLDGSVQASGAGGAPAIADAVWDELISGHTGTGSFGAGVRIINGGITSSTIASGAITSTGIAANAIGTTQLADGAITAAKLADNAITSAKIAASAIGSSQIASNAITSAQLAAGSIGSTQIAANAIGATQIATNAITSAKIATDAIGAAQIAANAIGTSEISPNILGASFNPTTDSLEALRDRMDVSPPVGTAGGGTLLAQVSNSSLTQNRLVVIQGEQKVITFITQANGRFSSATPTAITIKIKDGNGNVVTKTNADVTRVTEEADLQVDRITLIPADTSAMKSGNVTVQLDFDGQKAQLTSALFIQTGL